MNFVQLLETLKYAILTFYPRMIAKTAKKHKIDVIADEVYGHLAFGANPFVPMGVFGSMLHVLTLGSLSKRWIVLGWRLGWFVMTDPNAISKMQKSNGLLFVLHMQNNHAS
ncbi:putative aminotransferase, class I/classII, pyridoxal phosphate-dependent transferase, major [Helianthus debilis subsp. tardiflorus]